jgi:EEF1A lysine methyltransferase 4
MLHGSLWDPEDDVKANVGAYVDEVSRLWHSFILQTADRRQVARILKPASVWLYVTYRQPHFLKPLLAREGIWTIKVETLEDSPGSFEYFGFVITKTPS